MKSLVDQIASNFEAFAKDAQAQVENGNKAAGARARKVSLEIEPGDSPLAQDISARGGRRIFLCIYL